MADQHYTGPNWPIHEHLTAKNGSGPLWNIFFARNLFRNTLRDEVSAQIEQIRRDENLTDAGKARKLRELNGEINRRPEIAAFNANLKRVKERKNELTERLNKRPKPATNDVAELLDQSLRRDRDIRRFELLEPARRREAIRTARESLAAGDRQAHTFLADLISEPGILDPDAARIVETDLWRHGDAEALHELEQLVGRLQSDGKPDPFGGAIPCAEVTADLFFRWLNNETGGEAVPHLTVTDGQIILSVQEAKDPTIYRAARELASSTGAAVVIEGADTQPIDRDTESADIDGSGVITLSSEQAHDPSAYRAARDEALAEGKELKIADESE